MKTPKRDYKSPAAPQRQDIIDCTLESLNRCKETRWKRKNKIAQYKRTIARLTSESSQFRELWRGEHLKAYSPEWDAFMILRRLQTPAEDATLDERFEYWVTLREVGKLALNAASLAALAYGEAKQKGEPHLSC